MNMNAVPEPQEKPSLLSIVVALLFVVLVGGILTIFVGAGVASQLKLSGAPALLPFAGAAIPCLWLAEKLRSFLASRETYRKEKGSPRAYIDMSGKEKSLFEAWFSILKGVRFLTWLAVASFASDWILTDNLRDIPFSAWNLSYVSEMAMCIGVWWFASIVISHRYEIKETDRWGGTQLHLYEGIVLLAVGGLVIVGFYLT